MPGGEVGGEEEGRERRRAMVNALRVARCTGCRNIQAIAHRNGSASASRQNPAATGPDPAASHQERTAGQRQIADQQGDKRQRLGLRWPRLARSEENGRTEAITGPPAISSFMDRATISD